MALLARALEAAKFDQCPSACFFRLDSVCDLCLDGLLNVELQFRVQIATPRPRQEEAQASQKLVDHEETSGARPVPAPPPQIRLTTDLM